MKIRIREQEVLEHEGGGHLKEILLGHDRKLLREFVAARRGEEWVDFHTELRASDEVELVPWEADEAGWVYRHSLSHVMAQAVRRLFPEARLAIGPAIDDGFYYDFDVSEPFTTEDLGRIEKEMKRVVRENHRFEREEVGPRRGPRAPSGGALQAGDPRRARGRRVPHLLPRRRLRRPLPRTPTC